MPFRILAITGVRVLLGGVFLFVGLNGFAQWFPVPDMPSQAIMTLGALSATGFFYELFMITHLVSGILILFNVFTPLALLLSAPLVLNIFFFNLTMNPQHAHVGIGLLLSHVFLIIAYRENFRYLLTLRAKASF